MTDTNTNISVFTIKGNELNIPDKNIGLIFEKPAEHNEHKRTSKT